MTIGSAGRLLLLCCLVLAPPRTQVPPPWTWPLAPPHPVQAPFLAPATPYAAGHRGVDITAATGLPVVAAASGVVTFSGVVVDRPLVVIRHDDGLVSSIEPVVASVTVGSPVPQGSTIGTVGTGGHCDGSCVHLGVRRDGAYINPLLLLGEVPAAVLLPLEARIARASPGQARGWALR